MGIVGSPCSPHWRDLALPFFFPSWSLQCQRAVAVGGELSSVLQLGTDPSGGPGDYGSALRMWVLPPALRDSGAGMLQPQM